MDSGESRSALEIDEEEKEEVAAENILCEFQFARRTDCEEAEIVQGSHHS